MAPRAMPAHGGHVRRLQREHVAGAEPARRERRRHALGAVEQRRVGELAPAGAVDEARRDRRGARRSPRSSSWNVVAADLDRLVRARPRHARPPRLTRVKRYASVLHVSNADETQTRILETAWTLVARARPGAVTVARDRRRPPASRASSSTSTSRTGRGCSSRWRATTTRAAGSASASLATRELPPVDGLESPHARVARVPARDPAGRRGARGGAASPARTARRRGATAWASSARRSGSPSSASTRGGVLGAGLDGRHRRRLGVGALPAVELAPPGRRARLGGRRLRRPDRATRSSIELRRPLGHRMFSSY